MTDTALIGKKQTCHDFCMYFLNNELSESFNISSYSKNVIFLFMFSTDNRILPAGQGDHEAGPGAEEEEGGGQQLQVLEAVRMVSGIVFLSVKK